MGSSDPAAGGTLGGLGSRRQMGAQLLVEEERQRRELQRAFGVSADEVARAQWQRATPEH